MDLKKFNEAQKINSEIVELNDKIKLWNESTKFHQHSLTTKTKTDATLNIHLSIGVFDVVKEYELKILQRDLKELQTKFNAI